MILIDTQKQIHRIKKALDLTRHTKVMAVILWFKKPFIQHLLLLITSTLLAMSFGVWFLSSSHTSFARSLSFETYATVLLKNQPRFNTGADPILFIMPEAYTLLEYATMTIAGAN